MRFGFRPVHEVLLPQAASPMHIVAVKRSAMIFYIVVTILLSAYLKREGCLQEQAPGAL